MISNSFLCDEPGSDVRYTLVGDWVRLAMPQNPNARRKPVNRAVYRPAPIPDIDSILAI